MTASIWTGVLTAYLAWVLLAAAMVAVWGVYVFLAWIGRLIEGFIEKWSMGSQGRDRGNDQLIHPNCRCEMILPKPFDQEKD